MRRHPAELAGGLSNPLAAPAEWLFKLEVQLGKERVVGPGLAGRLGRLRPFGGYLTPAHEGLSLLIYLRYKFGWMPSARKSTPVCTRAVGLCTCHCLFSSFSSFASPWVSDQLQHSRVPGWHQVVGISAGWAVRLAQVSRSLSAISGNANGSSLNNQGSNANWWSSSLNSTTNAYNLNLNTGNIYPQNNNNKYNGFSVRCLQDTFNSARTPYLVAVSHLAAINSYSKQIRHKNYYRKDSHAR